MVSNDGPQPPTPQRQGTSEGTVDWHFNSLGGKKNYRPGETPQGAVSWILNLRQTSIPDPPPQKKDTI